MRKLALLLFASISAPLSAQHSVSSTPIPSISVGAQSEVKVSPDRANVQISVQTRAATAAAAANENAVKQKAVIDAIRALGIPADDISTIGYNVFPQQRYEPSREPVIVGYNVTNTVAVELKKLTLVGPVIDAVLAKGANMISSLRFYASNTESARREAIALAIQKARADAEAAARAAGGTIGGLLEINVGAYFTPPPSPMERTMTAPAAVSAGIDTPISPGEQTVTVSVSTRWSFVKQ